MIIKTRAAKLFCDKRGTSLVETAVVLPMLILTFAGMSDFAMGFARKLATQQAAARTMEMVTVAGVDAASNSTVLQSEAAAAANVPTSQVSVDTWLECNAVRQTDFNAICPSGQETARYASVSISNTYRPMFAWILPSRYGQSRTVSFTGRSSVRMQ